MKHKSFEPLTVVLKEAAVPLASLPQPNSDFMSLALLSGSNSTSTFSGRR